MSIRDRARAHQTILLFLPSALLVSAAALFRFVLPFSIDADVLMCLALLTSFLCLAFVVALVWRARNRSGRDARSQGSPSAGQA